ncbi:MAG: glycoside hydrolase family 2 TIM barrel-domain containing protein [Bacteroides helcogenes]|nr:glycoside hydrolase family 2 TIM barrel-domain containing protein [Bacteroides helcogenes]MDY5239457.1 glycoside hydrolase family 2 TIM barrel-domain containing protein [Bacteroides helcogenes]
MWCAATALLLAFASPAHAQRESFTLNDGWKFLKGECAAAADSAFNDSQWNNIHLPHTWNTDAYTEKDYYRGTGWYRRTLTLPEGWTGKRIFLRMEAASKATTIFVNGKNAGEHAGGYTACTLDLTPFLSGGNNVIAIRVDNARQDIAPISGDFTFFGGIYRDVWLTAVPRQHFNLTNHGSDGIFISIPQVSEEKAILSIRGEVKNDAAEKAALELVHSVYQPDGSLLQTQKQSIQLKPDETYAFSTETAPVLHPQLWTPETPSLYRVETILRNRKTKAVLDKSEHYTGFRWFHFDGNEGFFLNGKPYKLRGICRHQDQKPIGVALTDEMHRRDFHLMKEMGANFIRISHYPQDDALLEMCDKIGMLAWEEIPVIDIVPDTPGYGDNCERNLREMIRQHYNHPSIITWGYMNEILLVTQRRYKTEAELKPVLERTLALARRLEKALKEEDPARISTMAFHGSDDYNKTGLGSITDIVGWNLYQGWYGGDLTGFEKFLEEQHHNYPTHPMIVSEYGAGSDRRLHSLTPRAFDFSIEYQQKYLEHYLPVLENTPYVCGGTHWNFIDFSSALRDESMPRINNKGLVCSDRTPKDVYYYYKAAWRKDIPVLHIASRDWTHRTGIVENEGRRMKGEERVIQPVKIYTNLPEVELFINGLSLGKKQVENYTAVFDVPFTDGEQMLQAQGIPTPGNGMPMQANRMRPSTVYDALKVSFKAIPANLKEAMSAPATSSLELAVNVGSNCFFTSDESQLAWLPDQPYTEGGWGYIGGKEQGTQTEIRNTTDGPLFQTARQGIEGYRFDVPQGTYEVELLFTDIFRKNDTTAYLLGRGNGETASNGNSFGISANGKSIEANLSPCRESGHFNALRRKYIVSNDTDRLEIRFQANSGTCFLNGIKLRRIY